MQSDKLKALPCPNPWCPWREPEYKAIAFVRLHEDGRGQVHCWCHVTGPTMPTEAEAIAAWNARPVPAPKLDEDALSTKVKVDRVMLDNAPTDVVRHEDFVRAITNARTERDIAKDKEWSAKLAALASPKADHKTDGMTDADVDAWLVYALAGIDMTPDERASLKEVCAQAKRCNALERVKPSRCIIDGCPNERHQGMFIGDLCAPCHFALTTGDTSGPTTAVWGKLTAERDALRQTVEQMREVVDALNEWMLQGDNATRVSNRLHQALAKGQPAEKGSGIGHANLEAPALAGMVTRQAPCPECGGRGRKVGHLADGSMSAFVCCPRGCKPADGKG